MTLLWIGSLRPDAYGVPAQAASWQYSVVSSDTADVVDGSLSHSTMRPLGISTIGYTPE